jgi:hypothetical protein
MPIGPGKYDELCTQVREQTKARGVLLIVIAGDRGMGFSCQADLETTLTLPELLEAIARQIRADGGALAGPRS